MRERLRDHGLGERISADGHVRRTDRYPFPEGSSESKPVDEAAPQHEDPRQAAKRPGVPWPVRRGGWVLTAYEHSLSALFFILLLASIIGHAIAGAKEYSDQELQLVIVFASVYLRQRGSPESKPVAEPHRDTGS